MGYGLYRVCTCTISLLLAKDILKRHPLVAKIASAWINKGDISTVVLDSQLFLEKLKKAFTVLLITGRIEVIEADNLHRERRLGRPLEGQSRNMDCARGHIRLWFTQNLRCFLGKLDRKGFGIRNLNVGLELTGRHYGQRRWWCELDRSVYMLSMASGVGHKFIYSISLCRVCSQRLADHSNDMRCPFFDSVLEWLDMANDSRGKR